jgi:hypothetical protein
MSGLKCDADCWNVSIHQYIVEILEKCLVRDLVELAAQEELVAPSAQTDPVLAELWDNDKDAAYDRFLRASANARSAASSGVAA